MNCRELAELLCDFIDGDLTPEQRQHIEDHLCNCRPCVIYVETYRLTITLSKKLPCKPLPPHVAERLQAVLARVKAQEGGCGEAEA
jgi:hypothetical protein